MGVGPCFGLEDSSRQGVRGIVVEDRHGFLVDDWAMIVLIVGEMDRASADFRAVGEDGFMDMMAVHAFAPEGWKQGRVDIDDSIDPIGRDRNEFHESGHGDIFHGGRTACIENPMAIILIGSGMGSLENDGLNSRILGEFQPARRGRTGDHKPDIYRQFPGRGKINEILQCPAATGNQGGDGKSLWHSHEFIPRVPGLETTLQRGRLFFRILLG